VREGAGNFLRKIRERKKEIVIFTGDVYFNRGMIAENAVAQSLTFRSSWPRSCSESLLSAFHKLA
jgi:hypothetical protein